MRRFSPAVEMLLGDLRPILTRKRLGNGLGARRPIRIGAESVGLPQLERMRFGVGLLLTLIRQLIQKATSREFDGKGRGVQFDRQSGRGDGGQ
jgi:hypothetical protein